MQEYKILFMGTAQFAIPSLIELFNLNHKIISIYSSPSKKANRGMQVTNSPIVNYALAHELDYCCPINLKSDLEEEKIQELNPDIIIVIAYGLIIPKNILPIPRLGCFNLHGSLLPRWRGAAPIQRALIAGDKKTGITFMKMNEGLDTGDIVLSKEVKIDPDDSYQDLELKLAELGAKSFKEFFQKIENNKFFLKQDDLLSTYAKKIEKSETKLNWNEPANKILKRINAYNPNPGAWFELKGKRIKILKASIVNDRGKPGTILNDSFQIACGDKSIQPRELKKEGKEAVSIEDFLRGNKFDIGYIIQ